MEQHIYRSSNRGQLWKGDQNTGSAATSVLKVSSKNGLFHYIFMR